MGHWLNIQGPIRAGGNRPRTSPQIGFSAFDELPRVKEMFDLYTSKPLIIQELAARDCDNDRCFFDWRRVT